MSPISLWLRMLGGRCWSEMSATESASCVELMGIRLPTVKPREIQGDVLEIK